MGKPFSLTMLAAMSKKGVEIASHHFHTTPGTKFLALQCLFGVALLLIGSVLDAKNVDIPGNGLRWLYLCGSVAASMFLWSCLVDLVYLWLELRYFLWLVMLPAFHTLFKAWLNMLATFVLFSRLFDHSTVGDRPPKSLSPAEKWVKRLLLCGLLFMCVCVVVTGATGAVVASFYSEGSRQKIVAALQHEYVMYRLIRDMLRCDGDPSSHHHRKHHSPKSTYPPQQQQQSGLGRVSAQQVQGLADLRQQLPQPPVEGQQPQQQQHQEQQQLLYQAKSPSCQLSGDMCAKKPLSAFANAISGNSININSNIDNNSGAGSCDQLSRQPSHPPHLAVHLHPLHHLTPPPFSSFAHSQRSRRRRSQRILLRTASTGGATAIAAAAAINTNGIVTAGSGDTPFISMASSPLSPRGVKLVVAAGPLLSLGGGSQQQQHQQPGAGPSRRPRPQRVSWEVASEARTAGMRTDSAATAVITGGGGGGSVENPVAQPAAHMTMPPATAMLPMGATAAVTSEPSGIVLTFKAAEPTVASQDLNGAAGQCGGGDATRSRQGAPCTTNVVTAPASTASVHENGIAAIAAPYGNGNGIAITDPGCCVTPNLLSTAPLDKGPAIERHCNEGIQAECSGAAAYYGGGGGNHGGGAGLKTGSGGRSAPQLSYGTPSASSELGVGGDGDRGSSDCDGGLYGSDGDEDSDNGSRSKNQQQQEDQVACGCGGAAAASAATTGGYAFRGFVAWLRRCCGVGGGLQRTVFEGPAGGSGQQREDRPRRRRGQQRSVASTSYSSLQSLQTAMCCLQDSEMLHVRRTLLAALEIYDWLKERSQGGGSASASPTTTSGQPATCTSPRRDLHSLGGVRAELHALRRSSMWRWISPRVLLDELLMVYGGLTDSDIPLLARHFAEAVWECAAPEGTCLTPQDFLHIFPHEGDRRIAWDALDGDKDGLLKLSDIAAAVVSFLQQGRSMALTVRALRGLTLSLQTSLIAIINGIFLMAAYLSILDVARFFNGGSSSSTKTSLDIFSAYVLVVSLIFSEQIKHVLSGCVLILTQQPFDVGEELVIEEAPGWRIMGVVQDFNLFFLRVKKSTDGELVTLPLNKLTSSRFTNLTRSDWKIEQNYLAVDASTPPSVLAAISAAATQVINAAPGEYDVAYGFLAVFHGFEKPNKVVIRTFHRYRFNLAAPHKRIALGRHGIMSAVRETLDKYGIEFSELRLHAPLPPGCLPYGPGVTVAADAAAVVGAPGAVTPASLEAGPSLGLEAAAAAGRWGPLGRWGMATGASWGHAGGAVRG